MSLWQSLRESIPGDQTIDGLSCAGRRASQWILDDFVRDHH
jgi:hypothetical protein